MLRIISRLWSSVYDLLFYIEGTGHKSLKEIHNDLDVTEMMCRPYADVDDIETVPGPIPERKQD